jgi:hypothetical protein
MSITGRGDEYDELRVRHRKRTRWYEYVTQNNMFDRVRNLQNPDFSHTLMAGGVLNVPIERYDELLVLLADDIKDGVVPDLNEISAPITRLYMDLDFKDELVVARSDDSARATTATGNGGDGSNIQLYSRRVIKELDTGAGSEKFPAIVIQEEPLERRRYHNLVVVNCIAGKVKEYFPTIPDGTDTRFHVHCMWRAARFKYGTERYINAKGQHVEETRVTHRSFGMHLVWPNLYVTHEQALHLREGVIRALAAKFVSKNNPNNRTLPGLNGWESIVDENVYLPVPSMRMLKCDKYEPCPECVARNLRIYNTKKAPAKKRAAPDAAHSATDTAENVFDDYRFQCICHGSGKMPCNSIYHYEATFDAGGNELTNLYEKPFKDSTYKLLTQCCIRDPKRADLVRRNQFAPTDHVMQLPASAPRYPKFVPSVRDSLATSEKRAKDYTDKISKVVARYGDDERYEVLSLGTREFTAVQTLFNNAQAVMDEALRNAEVRGKRGAKSTKNNDKESTVMRKGVLEFAKYANLTVHKVRRGRNGAGQYYYLVDVTGNGLSDNVNYCFNIERQHKCEKNIYFKITPRHGIVQKCLCWSTAGRILPCKRFESPPCALTKAIERDLFSDAVLQRGELAQRESVLTAALARDCTPAEIRRRARASLEYPFEILAVDETEVGLLNDYVQNNESATFACSSADGVDPATVSAASSHSPYEPVEVMREQTYETLHRSESGTINVADIERKELPPNTAVAHVLEKVLSKRKQRPPSADDDDDSDEKHSGDDASECCNDDKCKTTADKLRMALVASYPSAPCASRVSQK